MTLSEYLKILYPAIGGRQTKSEFIISLILHSIISEPFNEEEKSIIEQLEKYLDNLSENWYDKLYNGHGSLNRAVAGEIIRFFDRESCESFFYNFSDESKNCISKELKIKSNIENDDISITCASLFLDILTNIAYKPRKKSHKIQCEKGKTKDSDNLMINPYALSRKMNMPLEALAQLHRDQARWPSKNNKGFTDQ